MHKGGLSLRLLNFGQGDENQFHMDKISFYRDIQTAEALNTFLCYILLGKYECKFDRQPTFFDIGSYYAYATRKNFPSNMHALIDCFFSHMYVWEREDGSYPVVFLIKYKDSYYITPLFQDSLVYSPELFHHITKTDIPFLFDLFTLYETQPFTWQIDNAWISVLLKHIEQATGDLVLVKFDSIRKVMFHIYNEFLTEFMKYPYINEENSKQEIFNYFTLVHTFLKV